MCMLINTSHLDDHQAIIVQFVTLLRDLLCSLPTSNLLFVRAFKPSSQVLVTMSALRKYLRTSIQQAVLIFQHYLNYSRFFFCNYIFLRACIALDLFKTCWLWDDVALFIL